MSVNKDGYYGKLHQIKARERLPRPDQSGSQVMFGRRKTPEPAPVIEMVPPEPLPDHNVELRAEWDDEKAAWEYQLYKVGHPIDRLGGIWLGDKPQPKAGEWEWIRHATSCDEAWAKRQADHYKVEIIYGEVK